MKTIYNWIVYSSQNSEKVSLTIKSIGGLIISTLGAWSLLHIKIDPSSMAILVDNFALLATQLLGAVSTAGILYGGIRKIWLSVRGQNQVLQ